jgi:hypothetical protein
VESDEDGEDSSVEEEETGERSENEQACPTSTATTRKRGLRGESETEQNEALATPTPRRVVRGAPTVGRGVPLVEEDAELRELLAERSDNDGVSCTHHRRSVERITTKRVILDQDDDPVLGPSLLSGVPLPPADADRVLLRTPAKVVLKRARPEEDDTDLNELFESSVVTMKTPNASTPSHDSTNVTHVSAVEDDQDADDETGDDDVGESLSPSLLSSSSSSYQPKKANSNKRQPRKKKRATNQKKRKAKHGCPA